MRVIIVIHLLAQERTHVECWEWEREEMRMLKTVSQYYNKYKDIIFLITTFTWYTEPIHTPGNRPSFKAGTPFSSILVLSILCLYLEDHMILTVLRIVKLKDSGDKPGKFARTSLAVMGWKTHNFHLRDLESVNLFCLDLSESLNLSLLVFSLSNTWPLCLLPQLPSLSWITDHYGVDLVSFFFFFFLVSEIHEQRVCSGPSFEIQSLLLNGGTMTAMADFSLTAIGLHSRPTTCLYGGILAFHQIPPWITLNSTSFCLLFLPPFSSFP